jgi:uncharacterized Zn-binding protein involved in type VI secretion
VSGGDSGSGGSQFKQARIGDQTDHGGQIIQGSGIRFTEGKKVARRGDLVSCPKPGHGVCQIIATITSPLQTENPDTAHVASITACGATIITGSSITYHQK